MNFGYVFVPRFQITHKNFISDCTYSCIVITSIFFQKRYFEKRKKNYKTSYGFWKIDKFIWNGKNDRLPIFLLNNYFLYQFFNFSALLCNLFRFFIYFWFVFNRSKVTKFGCVFAKRLCIALKKFLGNQSRWFANTIQSFLDKRDFRKLLKNLKKFICIRTN